MELTKTSTADLLAELQKRVDATSGVKLPMAQRRGKIALDEVRNILNPEHKGYTAAPPVPDFSKRNALLAAKRTAELKAAMPKVPAKRPAKPTKKRH